MTNKVLSKIIASSVIASTALFLTACSASENSIGTNTILTQEEANQAGVDQLASSLNPINIIQWVIPAILLVILIILLIQNQKKKKSDMAKSQVGTANAVNPTLIQPTKYDAPRPELQKEAELASQIEQGTEQTQEGQWALQIIKQGVQQGTLGKLISEPTEVAKEKKSLFGFGKKKNS